MSTEAGLPEREGMDYDVVVEKGSEVGAHILCGAVVDPIGCVSAWKIDPVVRGIGV
ncbi:hypothetical protein V5F31_09690 [Xanthobacter sp. V7C-4]|uniref:hypothetical protein n=1 Tax=Xanthobacter autotrophicus (strain ATCC BAA-1158 / Py2) TaxID=78245 RepID=UPI0037269D16